MTERLHTSTKTIKDSIKAILKKKFGDDNVRVRPSKDLDSIFVSSLGLQLPAAILIYGGSDNKADPSRTLAFSIILITKYETDSEIACDEYFDYLEDMYTEFDYKIDGQLKYTIKKDSPIQIDKGSGTCSLTIELEVEDN